MLTYEHLLIAIYHGNDIVLVPVIVYVPPAVSLHVPLNFILFADHEDTVTDGFEYPVAPYAPETPVTTGFSCPTAYKKKKNTLT